MSKTLDAILYPVTDIDAAKAQFTALLGTAPAVDQPYYVHFETSDGLAVGLVPNGHQRGMTGPTPFWTVDDIAGQVKSLVEAGGTVSEEPHDVGGGKQVAIVADAQGNVIGLAQG
ncbi:VOC family protein [Nocardia blacklockiae]|uniref:VOC family protein n=1 Tax=Nocardia blacklockiae TaxID=480036 RepID=UPI001893A409|nr:VOC family protein [Nocardia blacklockiae]MBF6173678.1 glyoxalase [Nocardia blacklockiae]